MSVSRHGSHPGPRVVDVPQPESSPLAPGGPAAEGPSGATVNAVYGMRNVVYYAVSDHELSTLTLINSGIAIALGTGTLFIGIAGPSWLTVIDRLLDPSTSLPLPPLGAPVLLTVVALIAIVVAAVLLRFRTGETNRIRRESVLLSQLE